MQNPETAERNEWRRAFQVKQDQSGEILWQRRGSPLVFSTDATAQTLPREPPNKDNALDLT